MGFKRIYPLVNSPKKLWKDPPFSSVNGVNPLFRLGHWINSFDPHGFDASSSLLVAMDVSPWIPVDHIPPWFYMASRDTSIIMWFSGWCLTYPSEKYESQIGVWNSRYMEKKKQCSKPPTSTRFYILHDWYLVINHMNSSKGYEKNDAYGYPPVNLHRCQRLNMVPVNLHRPI